MEVVYECDCGFRKVVEIEAEVGDLIDIPPKYHICNTGQMLQVCGEVQDEL